MPLSTDGSCSTVAGLPTYDGACIRLICMALFVAEAGSSDAENVEKAARGPPKLRAVVGESACIGSQMVAGSGVQW